MIHYTCDCCQRPIDAEIDPRYVVRMEVYAALETAEDEGDNDRDHLQEIQDILESLDDSLDGHVDDEVYRHVRFDLCGECRNRFVKNPLGRAMSQQLDFSKN
ncbi:hypothetical protein [Bythopirellula polymerisocia]|uniref:Uncharacterized protein n=1 Tax=Bythopirellula polymerisocia TaxID=2528003 RepID=A0A5C6CSN7_9BACT|nr:hypothetical protein [Bythopirellula polymerisocia]TWU26106.1 hypothetical protein Pla144_33230 [Bythopirellula polymerisocia]